ncbi:RecE family exodeoxyribonuclease [Serratia fonticola]|uniref:PD-(D/E)XK nuclease-like domain-containing protein n=1 Tax=Serratia fonticola TaxID=47917 RepID=A0AAE7SR06_SERFO|nr:RecE family exodeoxyribonuclease [Serratia fonticola]QXT42360.1 PD-(D/E)XK nuclease-like domain-containing protein [Serratia fonticola]
MQNVYAYYLKAKQKSGKPSLFIYFEAKNDARALRDLENKIEDAELDPKEYFKPVRTNFPVVDDLPIEGVFSEPWCDRYCLGDDGLTWELIVTEPAQQLPQVTAKPPAKDETTYSAIDLEKHTVIAAAWLFGRECIKMTGEQLKAATRLMMDDSQRYPQNVIMALSNLKGFDYVYPEMPIVAIAAMKAIWPPFDKAPELGKISQFATEYLNAKVEDRQSVISKWQTTPNAPQAPEPELPSTTTVVNAETKVVFKRGYQQTYELLDREIASALWVGDVDFENIAGEIDRWAQKKIKNDDEDFKRWSMALRIVPNILKYSRESIFGVVRNAPSTDLYHFPGSLSTWVRAYLTDYGVYEFGPVPEQEDQEIAGELEQPEIEDSQPEPEVVSMGGGQFDVSALFDASPLKDASAEPAPEIASNEGEKEEVDAIEDLEPTTRNAWLRREILTALEGKTSVMSVADVKELNANIGDLNHAYIARLLAKEIEPCDPFKQLAKDDIYHLTCDVLEGWIHEKDERINLLNERIESYLRDGSAEPQSVTHENKEVAEVSTPVSETAPEVITSEEVEPAVTHPAYFEPGRYHDIPNDVYHAANGISSTQVKDARISLMYFHGRHVIKSIARERSDALTFGSLVHTMALEPEKLTNDFNIEPIIPEGAFTGVASMRAFIEKHNATLPKMTDSDTLRSILDEHNAKLPTPYALGGNADEIGRIYTLLPQEFQSIAEGQKFTATAMKACIKEYNATLPEMLKTTGSRDALLEQLATIDLEFATREKAIPAPLPVSGTKEDMAARIKTILPEAIFADEILDAWTSSDDGRQLVTQQQLQAAKAIQRALFTHPSAGPLLQHQNRAVEVSYFGIDEDTGLEVRVRPDLEIDLDGVRLGVDLKSTNMGRVKQDFLRAKLHREIIDRDYHLSAAMYCDVAAFDQFFWIFVNKDEGYHWVAIVEASPDLLELGRLEYKKAMRDIKQAFDTETWPAPITEEVIDDLNDFDQRRLEALRIA